MKTFFTDDEWEAIASALKDYADYGDDESDIVDSIQNKINLLYKNQH